MIVGTIRSVVRVGNSLSFTLPPTYLSVLPCRSEFSVYIKGGKLVYSCKQSDEAIAKVKPRLLYQRKDSSYYLLTIPSKAAKELGIKEGDSINLYIMDDELYLEKLGIIEKGE